MSIDNFDFLLGLLALFLGILVVEKTYQFWSKYRSFFKPKGPIIDVEYYNKEVVEGYGFIVDGHVVLTPERTPFVFKEKHKAAKYLKEKYGGKNGGIVYQKWEPKTRSVKIGRVVNGPNEYKENQPHTGKPA